MWGEPRKNTEAYLVKQEAEKKKKIATEKGLDRLLVDLYHDCLKYYPHWIKNDNRSVPPFLSEVKEEKEGLNPNISFNIENRSYKIIRGDKKSSYMLDDNEDWYDLDLFLNGKRVFGITEAESYDEYGSYHRPVFVNAYVNDDWVEDFKKISAHKEHMSKVYEIEFAENPNRTKELKDAFGISTENIKIDTEPQMLSKVDSDVSVERKRSRWWVWIIILILIKIIFF